MAWDRSERRVWGSQRDEQEQQEEVQGHPVVAAMGTDRIVKTGVTSTSGDMEAEAYYTLRLLRGGAGVSGTPFSRARSCGSDLPLPHRVLSLTRGSSSIGNFNVSVPVLLPGLVSIPDHRAEVSEQRQSQESKARETRDSPPAV